MNALRAFLWLRWRLAVNTLAGGRGRDAMAFLAGWAAFLVRLILGLFLLGALLTVSVVSAVLGYKLASPGGLGPEVAILGLRIVLGVLSLVVVLFPLVTRSGGDLASARRLRLLPVKQRHLDSLDIVGALADPWLLVLMPVPWVLGAALWWQGRGAMALVALGGGALTLACLALAATAVRRLVALVLRDRRRAEAALLALIVGIMVFSFASMWLDPEMRRAREAGAEAANEAPAVEQAQQPAPPDAREEKIAPQVETPPKPDSSSEAKPVPGQEEAKEELRKVARAFPLALQILPSELLVHALVGALERRLAAPIACLLALAVLVVLLRLANRSLWRRTVGSPGISGRSRGRRRLVWTRLPGLSPAATAVAWVQATMALRTIAGKLALVMPTLVMLMVSVPVQIALTNEQSAFASLFGGPQMALGGVALAILSLQTFAFNQFAADGDGLARHILLPLSDRDLLLGKTAGLGVLTGTSALLSVLATAAVLRSGSPAVWLAVVLTVLPLYLLLAPVSVVLSLYFPKAMDLSGLGNKSKPHQLATFLGLLATAAVVLPTLVLVTVGTNVLGMPWLTALVVLLAGVVSTLVAAIFFRFAADAVHGRREAMLGAIREG